MLSGQCYLMSNMDDFFFQSILSENWLVEKPELHARVSAIRDSKWKGNLVAALTCTRTAVADCERVLAQYDMEQQEIKDLMQDGGPASHGSRGADQIIQAVEDAAEHIRNMPDNPHEAMRLAKKCGVMCKDWAARTEHTFGNPEEIIHEKTHTLVRRGESRLGECMSD